MNYRLKLPPHWKIYNNFHAILLTPHTETETYGPAYPEPPADIIDGEEEWEVDRIIKHCHVAHGKIEYQVLWKGYGLDQATWEPEDNLEHASKIIRDYRHRLHKPDIILNIPEQAKQTKQSRNRCARTRKNPI